MKKIEVKDAHNFYHPPLLPMPDIPCCLHHGSFFAKRKFDVHTGVDLYAKVGSEVYAVEEGEVVKVRYFTGKEIGCPHWNTTWAVDIESHSGIFCYGEILPIKGLEAGKKVVAGEVIGTVMEVLKEYKGKPTSMLHFSLHTHGWKYLVEDQEDPTQESFYDLQIDPTMLLIQLKNKADEMLNNFLT
jgi:hypothetical protein